MMVTDLEDAFTLAQVMEGQLEVQQYRERS